MFKKIAFFIFFLVLSVDLFAQAVNINLIAVNGKEEEQEKFVKYFLPVELKLDDILSTGQLAIDYDKDRNQYYAYGHVNLGPKQSKTLRISVRDVWRINPEEVEILKTQIDQNLQELADSEFYSSASVLREALVNQLDHILYRQEKFDDNIDRRIEEFRANIQMFQDLRANAFSSEYLKSYPLEPISDENNVRLVLEIKNPSDEERTITQKHYLPREVRARHIIDDQGFEVRFDSERQQAYLLKEEIFQPNEQKRYIVVLRNAWHIPRPAIDAIRLRTEKAIEAVTAAQDVTSLSMETMNFLAEKIFENLEHIQRTQAEVADIEGSIGVFRINKKLYEEAEHYLRQLERALALIDARRLEELERLQRSQVRNVLERIQALRGLSQLSSALFGRRISITMTWRIIWGILAFVAFFTSIHFFTWRKRSRYMGEEHAEETKGEIKDVSDPEENQDQST